MRRMLIGEGPEMSGYIVVYGPNKGVQATANSVRYAPRPAFQWQVKRNGFR